MKKWLTGLIAVTLSLSLTACGGGGLTAFDATNYMQGLLDETYLGVYDPDYLTSVDIDEEQAEETYQKSLAVEYEYFAENFKFSTEDLTEETKQATLDLLAELYKHARYEVKPAARTDDGFTVEIVVQPVNLIALVADQYMEGYSADFNAAFSATTQEQLAAMTEPEYAAFMTEYENTWASGIVALFQSHLDELGHLAPQSIIVSFKPDSEGYYAISDNDFANVDALILAYGY